MDTVRTFVASNHLKWQKYVVVIYLARSLDKKGDEIKKFWSGVFPTLMVAGIFAGLVLAEKNLSITSVIMFVAFILITVSGLKEASFYVRWYWSCVLV